jgi:hypothetical protein
MFTFKEMSIRMIFWSSNPLRNGKKLRRVDWNVGELRIDEKPPKIVTKKAVEKICHLCGEFSAFVMSVMILW